MTPSHSQPLTTNYIVLQIEYSEKYQDGIYEYRYQNECQYYIPTLVPFLIIFYRLRHVILPKDMAKSLPKGRTLTEHEWRGSGVQQSRGWEHYACHRYNFYSLCIAT